MARSVFLRLYLLFVQVNWFPCQRLVFAVWFILKAVYAFSSLQMEQVMKKEIVYIWQTFKFPGFVLITHIHDVFLYYFADRKGLNKKNAIAKIQSLFHQALFYLMKHNHPGITVLPYKWRLTKTLFNN